ncbi:uncharacterized protein B0H18DRAFT_868612 [Fomitopsis serialis]|uniref:uncharacterized protein n=1 Tax=Fomitopsis serialis TaxID=139415 RepID=UPI002007F2D0|nr:uncharacterized protein B0H18DRAFT_868612 [Neoantrodia serialis]KAH9936345.1 hypothetical protein B0H18DRAFT_868612 [Neoantrodia serialis]
MLSQGGVGEPSDSDTKPVVGVDNQVVLIHGDLSTLERVRSVIESRALEKTRWHRLQFVVIVPGVFHAIMACADGIGRTYMKDKHSHTDPSSTLYHGGIFRPQDTGKLKGNTPFRMMHDLIKHDGIARRLDVWRVEVSRGDPDVKTLEEWAERRQPGWEDIVALSERMVTRYVAQAGFKPGADAARRDAVFETGQLRHRDYLLYEETTYAMNHGDVGRLETCFVKWLYIWKATGKSKYATYFGDFMRDVHFVYPEGLRRAIRLNWLCNLRGLPGKFRAIDWVVELNNLYTKHIHGGEFSNRTLQYLLKESGLIDIYRMSQVNIADNFCMTNRTINHTKPDMTETFKKVRYHMQTNHTHEYVEGRKGYSVKDKLREGFGILQTAKRQGITGVEAEIGGDSAEGDGETSQTIDAEDLAIE